MGLGIVTANSSREANSSGVRRFDVCIAIIQRGPASALIPGVHRTYFMLRHRPNFREDGFGVLVRDQFCRRCPTSGNLI